MRAHAVWGEGGRGGGNFMTGAAFNMNGGGAAAPPKAMLDPPLALTAALACAYTSGFTI